MIECWLICSRIRKSDIVNYNRLTEINRTVLSFRQLPFYQGYKAVYDRDSIKGGQKNGPEELRRVAEAVMSGAVKYCPHGRPVAVELTRNQLEKLFKRA